MTDASRPRPERADSPELAAFRRLKADHPELAAAVDMQVEIVVLQRRVQARLSPPWFEFDAAWLEGQLRAGRPVVAFREIPVEWGEFRVLFRQISELLRRYEVIEESDGRALQQLAHSRRPAPEEVEEWYVNRPGSTDRAAPKDPGHPAAFGEILTLATRPFLARIVDTLHQRVDLGPWTRAYCPFCGGDPELALLPRPGDRRLACARCTAIWPFPEHACPHCDDRLPGHQRSYTSPGAPYRLIGCEACRRYIKAFDAQRADRPFMLDVDTIGSLPLDAAAAQRGYSA
jgi:hypothetical protein